MLNGKDSGQFFFYPIKTKIGSQKVSVRHADHLSFFPSYRANVLTKYFETVHIYS